MCLNDSMIGLFDSGSGGLSVLAALLRKAPHADIAYFGDIANAPYGVRPQSELTKLTKAGVAVLRQMGASEIVSACNSVSPSILAGAAGDMRVIEMTKPTARGIAAYKEKKILVVATPATIASEIYQRALGGVATLAIEKLAGAIEFGAPQDEVRAIVREAFSKRPACDLVLLGCTHYPLVKDIIEEETQLECIDPATFVADDVVQTFDVDGKGRIHFRISKDSEHFRARVATLLGDAPYSIEVV